MRDTSRRIIIDTDLGDDVDDAAAIMMALRSPELEVLGITTVFHNTKRRAEMVRELCEKSGRSNVPVYQGFGRPLIERPDFEEYPIQYGILENRYPLSAERNAVDFLIEAVRADPQVTIVGIGAMTNLALAFYEAPETMKKASIVAMGGVFNQSVPEWNMKCDPEAARIVMDYAGHLVMFGLEITRQCRLEPELLAELAGRREVRLDYFLSGVKVFQEQTGYPVTLHDALLIAYLLDESVVSLKRSDYTIELGGVLTRGSIVLKENAYELSSETQKDFYYAESIDVGKFTELVMKRI